MLGLPLPIKAIIREWRSGELTLLFIALVVAVASISAMNNFSVMVKNQLEQSAMNSLGADAVFNSKTPVNPQWQQKATEIGLKQNVTLSFLSMVESDGQLQLAQIKAVENNYPLRGILKIATNLNDTKGQEVSTAPQLGTVWLQPRLIPLLNTHIGEFINIGVASFKVEGVILEEPGQTGEWFTISPRIIMNQADVEKTKTIQPGSNLTYSWLLNGSKSQLNELQLFLKGKLSEEEEWLDSQNNISTVNMAIDKSLNYLNFGTLMSLVLAGVAISMASMRYCQRHLKQVALLRCFGASQNQVLQLYLGSIALLGVVACLLGAIIGYLLQPLLIKWLGGLLPQVVNQFSPWPFLLSMLTGMVLLFSFASANVWQLRKISAITLFRQQHLIWQKSSYVTYGLALLILAIMAYVYTQSWQITAVVFLGCIIFVFLVLLSLWLIFGVLVKKGIRLPLNWRFGFINIARNFEDSALQVIGIGLALTAMLSLTLLKNHLLIDWQKQLPQNTANYFVSNIENGQIPQITQLLAEHNISIAGFYPMVRGRLSQVNNQSVEQRYGEEVKNINALQRELNLSWTENIPEGNQVTEGKWDADPEKSWVSVEGGLAKTLGLKLGDTVGFRINNRDLIAQVTSLRKVDWSSFRPNFFMLFKPGLLNEFPKTMVTSIYLPPEKQNVLISISRQFPNVTLIDVASALNRAHDILSSAGNAITFITFFALLSGLVIVTLSILSLSGTKQQETQLLKIWGMRRNTLLWIRSSEAFLIGFYSGLLATITAVSINIYLAAKILDSHFLIPWAIFITVPLGTSLLTVLINLFIQSKQYQNKSQSY